MCFKSAGCLTLKGSSSQLSCNGYLNYTIHNNLHLIFVENKLYSILISHLFFSILQGHLEVPESLSAISDRIRLQAADGSATLTLESGHPQLHTT